MWLKKIFLKWKIDKLDLNSAGNKTLKYKPNRQLCEEIFNKLDPGLFKNYNPSAGLSSFINVTYITIGEYNTKIKETNNLLKQDLAVASSWIKRDITLISVDRFLLSSTGYYIDNEREIAQLKNNVLELCALMIVSDTATHGLDEHNLRMLTKLFIDIKEIGTKLLEVSVNK